MIDPLEVELLLDGSADSQRQSIRRLDRFV